MTLRAPIVFDTPKLAAFHEAGHVSIATALGARVEEVVLHRTPRRAHARTRVHRTLAQSLSISVAGLAVELQLFLDGRLRLENGEVPSEKEFINYAVGINAADDKIRFFSEDRSRDGLWPMEDDLRFINFAKEIRHVLYWAEIERIAEALLQQDNLDEEMVRRLTVDYDAGLLPLRPA